MIVVLVAVWLSFAAGMMAWALYAGHARDPRALFVLAKWSLGWPLVMLWVLFLKVVGFGDQRRR